MGDRWTVVDNDQKPKGKRLWWLKLPKDFFTSNNVIKKMRRLPGGDTYVVITLKLLLMSLDNGYRIFYEGVEDTFAKDIALTLDESPEAVEVTLRMLIQQGWLVEENAETIYAAKSKEMAGSEGESARRMRAKRLNDKKMASLLPSQCAHNVQECNKNVTLEKIREEKDKNRERGDARGEGDSISLSELCPEAFSEDWEPANPSAEDVISFASSNHFTAIAPEDFSGRFAPSWTEEGKRITNWRALYIAMELEARRQGEGD